MVDTIKIEILEDGTISIDTDAISGQNHVSADSFLAEITKLAGGERVTEKKRARGAYVVHKHGSFIHSY